MAANVGRIMGANPVSLTDLNNITDTNIVRVEMADSRRGRARVTVVVTEYGDLLNVIMDAASDSPEANAPKTGPRR